MTTAVNRPVSTGNGSAAAKGDGGAGSAATVGEQLFAAGGALRGAIDAAVAEVGKHSAKITDVRPARDELKGGYDALLKAAADSRGRGLLYPYLGSGVGNGALVELLDGSVKWDMITGIGVHFFGHSDAETIRASMLGAAEDTLQNGNLLSNNAPYQFSKILLDEAKKGSRLQHCFTTTSGVMANENAIKICYQKHAPASRVIAFKDCFMGRTVTMSQIGDAAANRIGLPLTTHVDYMPFYDEAAAKRTSAGDVSGKTRVIDAAVARLREYVERYPKQHACFIFELVQGEGGFNTAPREFFTALMDVCKASSIAVWDDEIQTFGRTGSMFAYDAMGLGEYIDVFCVGKMTQVCATLFTEEYNPGPGLLSGTFTSSGPAFRVGISVLERLRDGAWYGEGGAFARQHGLFAQHVRALAAKHPEWFPASPDVADIVGGTGGMMRFTPFGGRKDKVTKLCKHLYDAGVLVFYCGHGPYHIRMLPPLPVFKEQDWPRVFACIEKGMAAAAAEG